MNSTERRNLAVADVTSLLKTLQQEILIQIASCQPLSSVMGFLCRRVEEISPDVICSIVGVGKNGFLRFLAGPSLPDTYAEAVNGLTIGPNVGSCGTAIFRGEPVEVVDIERDPLWAGYSGDVLPMGLKACWSSPIKMRDGRVVGAFAFYFRTARGASDFERLVVSKCIDLCKTAIENEEARERLNELAFCDPLTGLCNRASLKARLDSVLEGAHKLQSPVEIFFIDLDRFRAVNDLHGQAVGDVVISRVANRLRSIASDADLIVRMGGDEFLVVRTEKPDGEEFETTARAIFDGIRGQYELENGAQVSVTASIGVASFPAHGTDQEVLIANAETALDHAKKVGRGYAVFAIEMQIEQHKRRSLERDAGLAGERGQLSVVFQPQADARSGTISGFEALVRWNHPELGFIPPSDFIPAAEASGAICAIGAFVLREACAEAASWRAPLRVAVNVSAAQIVKSDFVQLLKDTLTATCLPPERLEVEVTESLFIHDLDCALATLRSVKEMGVSVAIDDFGTGYSSLSTLRAFPFDRIKIDRSFVSDMIGSADASAIVNSVIGLGRAMGLAVVAEGVETQEQLNLLRQLGCKVIQGYFIGKPLPAVNYTSITGGERAPFEAVCAT